jgi:hypothetical protein
MAAVTHDFLIEQGATKTLRFIWKDSEGVPVDLTSYTARMQLRRTVSSDTVVAELTTENGGIVLGGTDGTVDVEFSAELTAGLSKDGVYDLELESAGVVTRLVQGNFTLSREVTR